MHRVTRRQGHSPENAKDLTQSFFERFLAKHSVKEVLRENGRFRTFLLTTLRRFLCDQFDRATALKRGGGVRWVPWDAAEGEAQFSQVAGAAGSPEELFDRARAETIVQVSLERLRIEHETAGQGRWFDELKRYLSQSADRKAYVASGQRLGNRIPQSNRVIVPSLFLSNRMKPFS